MNVVILGCGNIGYDCAVQFLDADKLWLLDLRKPVYLEEFLDAHSNAQFVYADATSEESIETVFAKIEKVDVLIVTVGTTTKSSSIGDYEKFHQVFCVNYFGVVVPITKLLQTEKLSPNAKIFVVTSTSGHHAHKSLDPYAPSKWALENFCSSLRSELKDEGKSVFIIRPSTIANTRSDDFKSENGITASAVAEKIYALSSESIGGGGTTYLLPNEFYTLRNGYSPRCLTQRTA